MSLTSECMKLILSSGLTSISSRMRFIQTSSSLWAVPPKKKKRVDPAEIMSKVQRKGRRIEKEIKRYLKRGRSYKPIDELEGDIRMKRELEKYRRDLPQFNDAEEENRHRALLLKKWTRFTRDAHIEELKQFKKVTLSRDEALAELKLLCPELYASAVEVDSSFLAVTLTGPVETPPIEDYMSPDGAYNDITKDYKYVFEVERRFIVNEKDKKKRARKKDNVTA